MARVGLLGRIMLVLLGALSLLVVATFGIDQWQRGQERSPYATRFPRFDQAGGIMALLGDADPAQRPAILRAINGEALRADIVDAPPDETAGTAGTAASPGMAATVGAASGMAVGTGASEVSGHAPARTTAVVLQRGQAMPPFARITCPVTQDASGPARKAATPAMSSGCPSRPSGVIRA